MFTRSEQIRNSVNRQSVNTFAFYSIAIIFLSAFISFTAKAAGGVVPDNFATIQTALNQAQPGDTIEVKTGVYAERISFVRSGLPGQYITLKSFPGHKPILDGSTLTVPTDDTGMVTISNQNYIILSGFEIRNYKTSVQSRTPAGIYVQGASHHIEIRGNWIHHIENNFNGSGGNAFGIAVYGTEAPQSSNNIIIDNNELDHLKLGSSETLALNGNVEIFEVTNNLLHDNNNIGIVIIGFEGTAPTSHDQARNGVVRGNLIYNIDSFGNPSYGTDRSAGGIYVDGGRDVLIERNVVHSSDIGIELASEHSGRATSNVIARNNWIYRNLVVGLSLGGYDTQRGSTSNCTIINNTFFQNDTLNTGTGEINIQFETRNNIFKNNIVYATSQGRLISNDFTQNSGNSFNYNLYYVSGGGNGFWQWLRLDYNNFNSYKSQTGNDLLSLFSNPQLLDAMTPDFHLRSNSPAVNAGENLLSIGRLDLDGQLRMRAGRVDIGADECLSWPFGRRLRFSFP